MSFAMLKFKDLNEETMGIPVVKIHSIIDIHKKGNRTETLITLNSNDDIALVRLKSMDSTETLVDRVNSLLFPNPVV